MIKILIVIYEYRNISDLIYKILHTNNVTHWGSGNRHQLEGLGSSLEVFVGPATEDLGVEEYYFNCAKMYYICLC